MRRCIATALILMAAGSAAAQQAAPDPARGIVCGEPYVIRRGDTLQRLAERVYGPEATYHALWAANRDRLGLRDPSLIEIGQVIFAPCPAPVVEEGQSAKAGAPDAPGAIPAAEAPAAPSPHAPSSAPAPVEGAASGQAAPSAAAQQAPQPAPAPAPAPAQAPAQAPAPEPEPSLSVLRVGGPALAREIVMTALTETLGASGVGIDDAPDGATASGGLRFALARPDCAAGAPRAPETQWLCGDLAWSAPVLEQALVWHARADAPRLTADAALAGLRLCRADSAPRGALGARADDAIVLNGGDARACLLAVADGLADLSVAEASDADAALRDRSLAAAVAEQPALTRLVALRAAAPRDDPAARAALAALDLGLSRLRASGEWFALVDAALAKGADAP